MLAPKEAATRTAPVATSERCPERRDCQVGLDGQHDNGPHILENQDPHGDAPRQRVQLEFVVEQLHHDHRAADGNGHGEIQLYKTALCKGNPQSFKQGENTVPESQAQGKLKNPGRMTAVPREHLVQVNLEADHEQEQDEADLGDGDDVRMAGDQSEADGTDENPRQNMPQDHRLAEQPHQEPHGTGADHAHGDVGDDAVSRPPPPLPPQRREASSPLQAEG